MSHSKKGLKVSVQAARRELKTLETYIIIVSFVEFFMKCILSKGIKCQI